MAVKVSVIVPVYNMEKYMGVCLDSIISQTLKSIEVVCINDGSSDSSLDILNQYHEKDERVKVFNQVNMGVSYARNRGLKNAEGEFVCFMDPDDFYPENNVLENLYNKAIENNALICGGSFSRYDNGKIITEFEGDYKKYTFTKEGMVDYRDYQFDFGYHRFLYNRKFLIDNDINFPPYRRCQDPPFFVKAMITAGKFYAVPQVVYRYRKGIQAKPASWPTQKFYDMLHGYLDDLVMAKDNKLELLHTLTVKRIEDDYVLKPSLDKIMNEDYQLCSIFAKINSEIDSGLLLKDKMDFVTDGYYLLKEFRELAGRVKDTNNLLKIERGKNSRKAK